MIFLSESTVKKCRSRYIKTSDTPDINIISNREACITGTKGVNEYTRDLIRLNCGHLILTIKGKNLNMTALSVEEVIIRGELVTFEFSYSQR